MASQPDPAGAAPLRCLIVGLGAMGTHHLRILDSWQEVELVAAVDSDDRRRAEALRTHPDVHGYASLADALQQHDLDFACLAVPVKVLPEAAALALDAGLHVFVEKPMAPDETLARAMIAAAEDRGLILGVGYVERFNPAVIALKDKLDSGAIGRIIQMHARRLSPFPNRDRMAGVALDLASHDIDLMRDLSGAEVERVSAERFGGSDEHSEDMISAVMRFDSGCTGLLEVNWITPTKVRELSILGEGGMFTVNYLTQDLVFYAHPTQPTEWDQLAGMRGGGEGDMIRYALERREPLRVQWEAFVDAVRAGGPAPVSGRDALATLSTAWAIRIAGIEHRAVTPAYRQAASV